MTTDFFSQTLGVRRPKRETLPSGPLESPRPKPKPKAAAPAAPKPKAPAASTGDIGIRGGGAYKGSPKTRGSVVDVDAKQNSPAPSRLSLTAPAPDFTSTAPQEFAGRPAPRVQGPLFDPKATAKAMGQFDPDTKRYESPDFSFSGKAKAEMMASLSKRQGEAMGDQYTRPPGSETPIEQGFAAYNQLSKSIPKGTLGVPAFNLPGAQFARGLVGNIEGTEPENIGEQIQNIGGIAAGTLAVAPRAAAGVAGLTRLSNARAINAATGGLLGSAQAMTSSLSPLTKGQKTFEETASDIKGGAVSGVIGGALPGGQRLLGRVGLGAAGGGLGQAGYNLVADRPLFEGVPESAAIGGVMGGAMPGEPAVAQRQAARSAQERISSEAALNRFFAAPDGPLPYTPDEAAAFRADYPTRVPPARRLPASIPVEKPAGPFFGREQGPPTVGLKQGSDPKLYDRATQIVRGMSDDQLAFYAEGVAAGKESPQFSPYAEAAIAVEQQRRAQIVPPKGPLDFSKSITRKIKQPLPDAAAPKERFDAMTGQPLEDAPSRPAPPSRAASPGTATAGEGIEPMPEGPLPKAMQQRRDALDVEALAPIKQPAPLPPKQKPRNITEQFSYGGLTPASKAGQADLRPAANYLTGALAEGAAPVKRPSFKGGVAAGRKPSSPQLYDKSGKPIVLGEIIPEPKGKTVVQPKYSAWPFGTPTSETGGIGRKYEPPKPQAPEPEPPPRVRPPEPDLPAKPAPEPTPEAAAEARKVELKTKDNRLNTMAQHIRAQYPSKEAWTAEYNRIMRGPKSPERDALMALREHAGLKGSANPERSMWNGKAAGEGKEGGELKSLRAASEPQTLRQLANRVMMGEDLAAGAQPVRVGKPSKTAASAPKTEAASPPAAESVAAPEPPTKKEPLPGARVARDFGAPEGMELPNAASEAESRAYQRFQNASKGKTGAELEKLKADYKQVIEKIRNQGPDLGKQPEAPAPPKTTAPKPEPPVKPKIEGPLPVKEKPLTPDQEARIAELKAERIRVEKAGSDRLREIRKSVSVAKQNKPMNDVSKEVQAQMKEIDSEIAAIQGGKAAKSKKGDASIKFNKPGAETPAPEAPPAPDAELAAAEKRVADLSVKPENENRGAGMKRENALVGAKLSLKYAKEAQTAKAAKAPEKAPKPKAEKAKPTAEGSSEVERLKRAWVESNDAVKAKRLEYQGASPERTKQIDAELADLEAKRGKASQLYFAERDRTEGFFGRLAKGETLGSGLGGLGGGGGTPAKQGFSLGEGPQKAVNAVKKFFGKDDSPSGKLARKINEKIVAAQEPERRVKTVARAIKASMLMSTQVAGKNFVSAVNRLGHDIFRTGRFKGAGKGAKEGVKGWKDIFIHGKADENEINFYKGWEPIRERIRAKHPNDDIGFSVFAKEMEGRGFTQGDVFKFERYEKIRQAVKAEGLNPDSGEGKEALLKAWMLPSERVDGVAWKAVDAYSNFGFNKVLRGTELPARQAAVRQTIEAEAAYAAADAGNKNSVYLQTLSDIEARFSGKSLGDEARERAADMRLARALAAGDEVSFMRETAVSRAWNKFLNRAYEGVIRPKAKGEQLGYWSELTNTLARGAATTLDINVPFVKATWNVLYYTARNAPGIGPAVELSVRGLQVPYEAKALQRANPGLKLRAAVERALKDKPEIRRGMNQAAASGALNLMLMYMGYAFSDNIDEPETYIPGNYEGAEDITKRKALEREGNSIHTPWGSMSYEMTMPVMAPLVIGAVLGKAHKRDEQPWTEAIPRAAKSYWKLLTSSNPFASATLEGAEALRQSVSEGGEGIIAGTAKGAVKRFTDIKPISTIARITDTNEEGRAIKRKPDSLLDNALVNVPYGRKFVGPQINAYGQQETEPRLRALDPTKMEFNPKKDYPESAMLDAEDIGMSKSKRDVKGGETAEEFAERQRVEGSIYEGKTKWLTAPTLPSGKPNPNYEFLKNLDKYDKALSRIGMTAKEMRQEIIKRGMNREATMPKAAAYLYGSIYTQRFREAHNKEQSAQRKAQMGAVLKELTKQYGEEE